MRMTRKLLLVLALAFGYASPGAGQQTAGSTRQRMTLELLSAMNARDTVALRRFVDEHFVTSGPGATTPAVRVARLGAVRTNLGARFHRTINAHHRSIAAAIEVGDADAAGDEMHDHVEFLRPFYEKAWRTLGKR